MPDGQRLKLNDGTTIEGGAAGYSNGFLWCYFSGYTMPRVASLFFDPAKTSRIVFEYGEMSDTFTGFTECVSINTDADGNNSVCLKRGE
jgi:hypothetical protein